MFNRMSELPSLLLTEGLPMGLGIAAGALARAAAYNMLTQSFPGQAWVAWGKTGYDLVATVAGLVAAGYTDDMLRRFFIGFAGFSVIGFTQSVIFHFTKFDVLSSISRPGTGGGGGGGGGGGNDVVAM
jgi:hypothetical protein